MTDSIDNDGKAKVMKGVELSPSDNKPPKMWWETYLEDLDKKWLAKFYPEINIEEAMMLSKEAREELVQDCRLRRAKNKKAKAIS